MFKNILFSRNINPDDLEYQFGEAYNANEYYPSNIVYLRDPYIFRDLRGQTINITPFQYNPIEKILRVYTRVKINVFENGVGQVNVLERDRVLNGTNVFGIENVSVLLVPLEHTPFLLTLNSEGIPPSVVLNIS